MYKSEFKQHITKKDVINVLNSMINEKNKNSISQYINKISDIGNLTFQQLLTSNNISTKEDIRTFFEEKILESETEQTKNFQEFKKFTLNDLDMENAYFHFTDEAHLKSIRAEGLVSNIGKHSEGIDKKPSIFFSYGMIPTIHGADVWIKWLMHRMYGEKNQFHIYDGLDESEIKAKQSEWTTEFLNKQYLSDDERKEKAFELIFDSLKRKVILTIDLKQGVDFSFDDIDYNKQEAIIERENGNIIPYLFAKEMYGDYSDFNSAIMDKWNMHTFFGTQIEPERIMQVVDSKGRTDMLHILIKMYEKCKFYKDCKLDILDDFISFAKQKKLNEKQVSTQRLGQETLEEQKDIELLDEIEHVQARQEKLIIEQQNGQNR